MRVQVPSKMFELPELRYDEVPGMEFGSKGHVCGHSWNLYLEAWVERMDLSKHIRLNTTVAKIRRQDAGWQCDLLSGETLGTDKLILATGTTSILNYPNLRFSDFSPPVIHNRDFHDRYEQLEKAQEVTVYGAGKGSMDVLAQLMVAGKRAKWIIRREGRGPGWLIDGSRLGILKVEMIFSRLISIVFPSVYQDDGFSRLHHLFKRTPIGRLLGGGLMNLGKTLGLGQMGSINENLQKAIPEHSPFWLYHPLGADNYDISFWDHVRNGDIKVIRDTIKSMKGKTIDLVGGERFDTDAVIFATGWKTSFPMFTDAQAVELGLPAPLHAYTDEYIKKWKELEREAENKIYSINPFLKSAPMPPEIPQERDRSIAILGNIDSTATLQYMIPNIVWTMAYMLGELDLPSKEEMEMQAAYELRFSQIRHPGSSNQVPNLLFDTLPVSTMFLKELGLNPWRKGKWFRELFDDYSSKDFQNIANEFKEKYRVITNFKSTTSLTN
ncbi:hypothetical protein ABW21_db0200733 [Orbilia brochopaga]|nr:hypothetical protein ABW21_db0200733 [Drechslerella brochopaga]